MIYVFSQYLKFKIPLTINIDLLWNSRKPPDSKTSSAEKPKDHTHDKSNSDGSVLGYNKSPVQVQLSEETDPKVQTVPVRTNYDPYHDNSGDRGDKDYRTLQPPLAALSCPGPSKQRFDQTHLTINERFLMIRPHEVFSPTETITVDIERSIPGSEPAIIPREIYVDQVVIVRQKDEGIKPLCQRCEFLAPQEEYAEKRIIRVSHDTKPRSRSYSSSGSARLPLLSEQWTVRHDETPVHFFKKQGMTREELDR